MLARLIAIMLLLRVDEDVIVLLRLLGVLEVVGVVVNVVHVWRIRLVLKRHGDVRIGRRDGKRRRKGQRKGQKKRK